MVSLPASAEKQKGVPVYGFKIIVATLVGASLFVPPSTSTDPPPPGKQPKPTLNVLGAFGSGCPKGTTAAQTAADNTAFSLAYSAFRVSGNDYKSCVLSVRVAIPAGWTYQIPSVANRAAVTLDAGATATLTTAMWFTGSEKTARVTKKATGPQSGAWNTSAVPHQAAWAPCGTSANLTIAQTMRVAGNPANTAGLLATTLGVPKVRRC
ncbi:DUF4360 domain-containing protein [Actinoplanes sp. NEAU-A12]|uniref:DUF4360 domain-containing protein n=1 Tax=Actinoplanes sandaracinus TaxID=3045177 RepID=A0ABT6WRM5_9ACTN|nr:DUF4360 domain-containing protein [Actinoplanes sandaracinus]MDI6102392.1 DUF4360 domain-containing protein [Actinoplanes sandaracinus]